MLFPGSQAMCGDNVPTLEFEWDWFDGWPTRNWNGSNNSCSRVNGTLPHPLDIKGDGFRYHRAIQTRNDPAERNLTGTSRQQLRHRAERTLRRRRGRVEQRDAEDTATRDHLQRHGNLDPEGLKAAARAKPRTSGLKPDVPF